MSGVHKEYQFPTTSLNIARIRFDVELSEAENIKWDASWEGVLSSFAMYSHEVYMMLAEALKEKCGGNLHPITLVSPDEAGK